MFSADTYVNWVSGAWTIQEGEDYPHLFWEGVTGEAILGRGPWAGRGLPEDPFLVNSAEELDLIGQSPCEWDKHFRLTGNIDLVDIGNEPNEPFHLIGSEEIPFTGVFDGDGYVVSSFSYETTENERCVGLFRRLGSGGSVKGVKLSGIHISATFGESVGSLVGMVDPNAEVIDCFVESGRVAGKVRIGGLVGTNMGAISNCQSDVSVDGKYWCGGLIGYNEIGSVVGSCSLGNVTGKNYVGGLLGCGTFGIIDQCFAIGQVSGVWEVGGLAGLNYDSEVSNCYATGDVSGGNAVGGLIGWADSDRGPEKLISSCYSTGKVVGSGAKRIGGLLGFNNGHAVFNCYWDKDTSGQTQSRRGMGKTTEEMKSMRTFLGWGYGEVWTINEGIDYPRLAFENKPGTIIRTPMLQGRGDPNEPYLIYTAGELNKIDAMWKDWDKHFRLMADIDLGEIGSYYNPIGDSTAMPFTGVFDGNGHAISNFRCLILQRDIGSRE